MNKNACKWCERAPRDGSIITGCIPILVDDPPFCPQFVPAPNLQDIAVIQARRIKALEQYQGSDMYAAEDIMSQSSWDLYYKEGCYDYDQE